MALGISLRVDNKKMISTITLRPYRHSQLDWETIKVATQIPAYAGMTLFNKRRFPAMPQIGVKKVRINFVPQLSHLISRNDGLFLTSYSSNFIPLSRTK